VDVPKKIIQQYINSNSSSIIRDRAKVIKPILLLDKPPITQYRCIGSTGQPYTITIEARNAGNSVSSSCSCPYNFGGLCKHEVASLLMLIDDGFTANVDVSNKIKLNNGVLDQHIFDNIPFQEARRYYDSEIKLKELTPDLLIFSCEDYKKYTVQLAYNRAEDILQVDCTCSKKGPFCEHTEDVVDEFMELFGPTYFSANFKEDVLTEYLKSNGHENNEKNRKLFKVKLTKKGILVEPLYKNIQPKGHVAAFSLYANEEEKIKTLVMAPSKAQELGLGFCFSFDAGKFGGFFPFFANWNKARTELSTKFEELDGYTLNDKLRKINQTPYRNSVLDGIELGKLMWRYFYNPRNQDTHKEAYSKLAGLAKEIVLYPAYEKVRGAKLSKKTIKPIRISDTKAQLFYKLDENKDFYTLKASIRLGDKEFFFDDKAIEISSLLVKQDDTIYLYQSYEHALGVSNALTNYEYNYFKEDKPLVWDKVVKPLSKSFEIKTDLIVPPAPVAEEKAPNLQVYVSDYESSSIVFRLAVDYNGTLVEPGSPELLTDSTTEAYQVVQRNTAYEESFVNLFKSLHPNFNHNEGVYVLPAEELLNDNWFLESSEKLKEANVEIFGANTLKSFLFNLNKAVISTSVKSGIDWFDVDIKVTFGDQVASLKELKKSFVTKSKYVKLDDGTLGILPDKWMDKFKNFFTTGELRKDGLRMSNYSFGIVDELYNELEVKPDFLEELYQRKQRLFNLSEITEVPKPKGVTAKLRDYQHEGLNWMVFLDQNKLGGCLADDMGLGKTLQTIAFLKHIKDTQKPKEPSIIIAPTSLIFNWNQEVEKFCKSLKILTYTGPNRKELIKDFGKTDLIITTYGTIINDIEFLQKQKFHYVILDESQAIKNPNSKRYKSVRLLQAYNRMVLTGTPIENNTFDLYAQLNFLNPGLLGSMAHFKQVFADGIDKFQDKEVSELLHKIITPFVLRRTKEQVATELPDKTENVIYCEMGKEQKKVYEFYKKKYRDYLTEKIDENGEKKAQMYILEGLTKLRQVCNSTALVSTESEDYGNNSVKLDTLTEHILEKTGKHKILVFSQFVSMLSLIKKRLDSENILYEYLDGATTNRQKCVENFQNNKDIRVFLISLKAGGTGLNLTEADYVYIVDPWWNPAVENQAIDRCYRIGQQKHVMAYRMICKDSIEEKIVKLQGKKKSVASSIIKMDEGSKSFNLEEVKDLFG
jgi:SNF2 family DNA or RNA helicase